MSDEVTPVPLTPTELAEYQSLVENTRSAPNPAGSGERRTER